MTLMMELSMLKVGEHHFDVGVDHSEFVIEEMTPSSLNQVVLEGVSLAVRAKWAKMAKYRFLPLAARCRCGATIRFTAQTIFF